MKDIIFNNVFFLISFLNFSYKMYKCVDMNPELCSMIRREWKFSSGRTVVDLNGKISNFVRFQVIEGLCDAGIEVTIEDSE